MLYDVSDACFFDVSEQKEAMVPEEEKRTGKKNLWVEVVLLLGLQFYGW